eukprot:734486-Ditylum_brightwellii.AAC.1
MEVFIEKLLNRVIELPAIAKVIVEFADVTDGGLSFCQGTHILESEHPMVFTGDMDLSKLDDFVDNPKLLNLLPAAERAAEIIQNNPTYQSLIEGTNSARHDVAVAQEAKQKIEEDIAILQNELLQQRSDTTSTTRTNRNSISRVNYSSTHTGHRRISNEITTEDKLKATQDSLIAANTTLVLSSRHLKTKQDELTAWKEDNDFLSVDKWISYDQKVLKQ